MTRTLVKRAIRKNMENLVAMAKASGERLPNSMEG
jgi:hypothetical protein